MHYRSHLPAAVGTELRIQVALGQDCHQALRGMRGDLRRPAGRNMADLYEIELAIDNQNGATIALTFTDFVNFEIDQTTNRYLLTIVVDTAVQAPPLPSIPQPAPTPRSASGEVDRPPENRGPSRPVVTPPTTVRDRYVVRMASPDKLRDSEYEALKSYRSRVIYAHEVSVGDRHWQELRVGFFDSEDEARVLLARLQAGFSSAWIAVASHEEQTLAQLRQIEWPTATPPVTAPSANAANALRSDEPLPDERIAMMMADAKDALLRRELATSIELYARVADTPGNARRRDAREFLGVALEKSGEADRARGEYQRYLREFPDGDDSDRVRQRLAGLAAAGPGTGPVPAAKKNGLASKTAAPWQAYGSASQYYLRGVALSDDDEADFVAQSAVLSQAQFFARKSGERFDLAARADVSYLYDLVENGPGDNAFIAYAYIDMEDTKHDVSARVGRQRQHSDGVLGRFDGIRASYRHRPDLTVSVAAGFPVDSPRFRASPDHYFYGAGIELADILDVLDVSVFTNVQTVDGIADRTAFGTEAQYRNGNLTLLGLLDYDASYNVLNTGFLTGNWRLNDRLTVYGRLRGGAAPFLTTRNAIIGQPVNTVSELFSTYTEGQIRRLARNRTAEERAGSVGLSTVLTPRLQLQADISYLEYSATVASGGVAAFPDTGPQYNYGGQLVGTGFLQPGQVFIVGYRHDETRSSDAETVFADIRYSFGDRVRFQSRLDVSRRVADQNTQGNIEHWIANPMLRIQYTFNRRYQVELEVGGQWSNRSFPPALAPPLIVNGEIEQSDYYLQLGYSVEF